MLPARYFSPAPPDKVKQLIPAAADDRITFPGTTVVRPVLGYALVEQADGSTRVEGLIASDEHLDVGERARGKAKGGASRKAGGGPNRV